jgi:hypothetical protein
MSVSSPLPDASMSQESKASKQRTQNPPKQSSAESELRLPSVVVFFFFFFFAFVFLLPSSSSRASYLLNRLLFY